MAKISQEELKKVLDYDPVTGIFLWKIQVRSRGGLSKIGYVAGGVCSTSGYTRLMIDGQAYLAHRLAWLYVYGVWPVGMLDHKNGAKHDNRIGNLREASKSENAQNMRAANSKNQIGFLGVSFFKKTKKWRARIGINGKQKTIGYFDDPHDAHKAYLSEKRKIHPFCEI